ncbi:hypothetical protein M91_21384, partial [Bos mutus]
LEEQCLPAVSLSSAGAPGARAAAAGAPGLLPGSEPHQGTRAATDPEGLSGGTGWNPAPSTLQVLGFAAFFALVLKRVEDEEEPVVPLPGCLSSPDPSALFRARRNSRRDTYQPPLASDIEKMKTMHLKEQKAFALIREILAYLGFLWMLLLVAYGQRDPSAYHFNRHLEHSFTKGFSTVLSFQQFFTWANTTLVSNLYSHYP